MTLEVEPPHPPDLTTSVRPGDDQGSPTMERRADIEAMLHDSAWKGAFADWRGHTDLLEAEWQIVLDLELIQEFDFWWDGAAEQIRYTPPVIPEDWRDRDLHPELDEWATVSAINSALDELGQIVADLLEAEYVGWGGADIERDSEEPL